MGTAPKERAALGQAPLRVEWHGCVPYEAALELQQQCVRERRAGACADRLLLLEHPPVVTLGRATRPENLRVSREALLARGVGVHEVARGGDVTYHAPGQLVGYPIVDLAARGRDVHVFLRAIEQALIEALARLGVGAQRIEGMTGVFVSTERPLARPRKIASIGVGVRHWVSWHGFALNVSVDLAGFDAIVPCGLGQVDMTSLAAELERAGRPRPRDLDARARDAVSAAFRSRFAGGVAACGTGGTVAQTPGIARPRPGHLL